MRQRMNQTIIMLLGGVDCGSVSIVQSPREYKFALSLDQSDPTAFERRASRPRDSKDGSQKRDARCVETAAP